MSQQQSSGGSQADAGAESVWCVACSHHPGGWCQEYSSLEDADKALAQHKQDYPDHTDVKRMAGKCPF